MKIVSLQMKKFLFVKTLINVNLQMNKNIFISNEKLLFVIYLTFEKIFKCNENSFISNVNDETL